jgi:predicted nucleic acid-binding protein
VQTLVDSSVWLDYFLGVQSPATDLLDRLLGEAPLAVSDITFEEVLRGLPGERNRQLAREALRKFWIVEIHGLALAEASAANSHALRDRGLDPDPVACRIATFCIENGFALLHDDEEYDAFEEHLGLRSAQSLLLPLDPGARSTV